MAAFTAIMEEMEKKQGSATPRSELGSITPAKAAKVSEPTTPAPKLKLQVMMSLVGLGGILFPLHALHLPPKIAHCSHVNLYLLMFCTPLPHPNRHIIDAPSSGI